MRDTARVEIGSDLSTSGASNDRANSNKIDKKQDRQSNVKDRLGAKLLVNNVPQETGLDNGQFRPRRANVEKTKTPLPPFADSCPVQLRCSGRLIGLTELYVKKPRGSRGLECPECGAAHPLYVCPYMLRANLPERWQLALDLGVCLNCLRYGHSSFTCKMAGNCAHCKLAHNSVLCPAVGTHKRDKTNPNMK